LKFALHSAAVPVLSIPTGIHTVLHRALLEILFVASILPESTHRRFFGIGISSSVGGGVDPVIAFFDSNFRA
jgi:hypothetical protein